MNKLFLSFTLIVFSLVNYSCKKPKDPTAIITIVDVDKKPVQGANVNINANAAVGKVIAPVNLITDTKGNVYYTQQFEAILEAKVTKGKLTATEYFQLKSNEETLKTIIIK